MTYQVGRKITGTVKSIKGTCSWGHKVADKIELSCHNTGNLCGFFYHDIFPTLMMLQFDGKRPWGDPDIVVRECPDRANVVTIELRREN